MKIKLTDGGDGSTFVKVILANGKEVYWNPDVPYNGSVECVIDENGKVTSQKEYFEGEDDED